MLDQDWDFNDFLYDSFNVLIDFDNLRNDFLDLDNLWYVDSLLDNLFNFVNFRNFSDSIDDFFNDLYNLLYLLDHCFNRHNFLSDSLNLNNSVLDVRNDFLDFFDSFLDNNIVNVFFNFNNLDLFLFNGNNFFAYLIYLFDLSVNNLDRDHFLNDSINWNLNLDRDNNVSIYLYDFRLFDNVGDNFFDFEGSGDFSVLDDDSLRYHFLNFGVFLVNLISDKNLSDDINWPLDFDVNVARHINLDNSFLEDRVVHNFFDLDELRDHYNLLDDLFNDLRHFDYFLDNSWDNNNSFNYFLNLDDFRNFHKFFDNFLDNSWYCLYSFNDFLNWDHSLFDNSDNFRLLYKVIDDLLDFFDSVLVKNFRNLDLDFLMNEPFDDLDDWLFNYFSFDFNNFMNQGHLNDFLNHFLNGSVLHNGLFNYSFNFFNSVSVDNFFNDNFNFDWLFDNVVNLNDFFNDSRDFDNLLDYLNYGYHFFNNSVDRFVPDFDVVSDVGCRDILDSFDDLFDNFLNFDDFWDFNSDLNDFLNDLVNRN